MISEQLQTVLSKRAVRRRQTDATTSFPAELPQLEDDSDDRGQASSGYPEGVITAAILAFPPPSPC